MGLYINPNYSKNIYKSNNNLTEPNQGFFIKNHTAEMIEEQKKINRSLDQSLQGLRDLFEEQEYRQSSKWTEFNKQLTELQVINKDHETRDKQVIDQLRRLEADNGRLQAMVHESQLSEQQVLEELNRLVSLQEGVERQLNIYGEVSEEMKEKMQQHTDFYSEIAEQMESQERNQEGMKKRLDNQEALTEKITRQLENLRAIMFERTSYLSDKMDDLSSYVMKFLSKDPFQTQIMLKEKENTRK